MEAFVRTPEGEAGDHRVEQEGHGGEEGVAAGTDGGRARGDAQCVIEAIVAPARDVADIAQERTLEEAAGVDLARVPVHLLGGDEGLEFGGLRGLGHGRGEGKEGLHHGVDRLALACIGPQADAQGGLTLDLGGGLAGAGDADAQVELAKVEGEPTRGAQVGD